MARLAETVTQNRGPEWDALSEIIPSGKSIPLCA